MKAILFDMDGVLYEGERPIPGAARTLAWCRERGIPFRFLTNTTSRPREALVAKLADMGITADVGEIVTPPVAACDWLSRHVDGPVAAFVPERTRDEFTDLSLAPPGADRAAAVIVGDLGEGWDFDTLNRAFRLIFDHPGTPLVALGLTRYWQAEDGARLDAGPFVRALEYALGIEAVVMGKPGRGFFDAALATLGVAAPEAVMIGDDIRSDVDAAMQAGLAAIQLRSGKFRERDLDLGIHPTAVVDSIADLPAWWEQHAPDVADHGNGAT
ncbi:MAG: TIGR01458 family HAD-type hydrolase [Guyparkeria sp.]|uniref:TIGR01458 family HAD-type hydrolase n=1 Tax=Guyparkeria sp. TaxID=2035736 RepID=UPI00397BF76D